MCPRLHYFNFAFPVERFRDHAPPNVSAHRNSGPHFISGDCSPEVFRPIENALHKLADENEGNWRKTNRSCKRKYIFFQEWGIRIDAPSITATN